MQPSKHLLTAAALLWGVSFLPAEAQPNTQVPPPPSLQGTVWHIAPSRYDQTSTIQSKIKNAASGDTIFFDAGNHRICGTVRQKAGQLYVGPTVTYPLLGQNSRAGLVGCNHRGQFIPASSVTFYGLQMNGFNSYVIAGTSNHLFRNNILDNQDPHSRLNQEWLCNGGDTNTVVDWNTFQYGSGINNGECARVGDGSTNFKLVHNRFRVCKNGCVSPTGDATNEEIGFNVFDWPGQNCVRCGTASAVESAAGNNRTYHVHHNYVTGEPRGGPFCFSIIGGQAEVDHNYCGGNGAAIEWDPHYGESGKTHNIHDNYMDAVNWPRSNASAIFGPYANSRGSTLANNRVLGGNETAGDNSCTYSAGETCYQVNYARGPTDNPGIPTPPAAGAAP
jgi:hypothetical protein